MTPLHRLLPVVLAGALTIGPPAAGLAPVAPVEARDAATSTQPGVLILGIDDFTLPYIRLIFEAMARGLAATPDPPAVYFESLDASRFGEAQFLEEARGWLRQKYRATRVDMVVPLGTDAFQFLVHGGGEPWPAAQVLYVETARVPFSLPQSGGLEFAPHFAGALATIKAVLPGTTQLAVVIGQSAIEQRRWRNFLRMTREAGLEPLEVVGLSLPETVARVSQLPPRTALMILVPIVDAAGRVLPQSVSCAQIAQAANVPTFTLAAHDLGCGAVGGLMRDWTRAGAIVAEETVARLARPSTEVKEIPASAYSTLAFDQRQLRRWQIPESRLPPGSEVRFREPSLWRDNRGTVVAVVAVTALQSLLIAGLVFEHHRRRRAEQESRTHLTAMAHLDRRAAMGELATSLAHEISQPLHGILQNVDVADMVLDRSPGAPAGDELREIIGDIRKADVRATEVIKRMRALLVKHELEARPLNINDVARETVAIVRPDAAARGVQLDARLADRLPVVHGDAVHLQQVVLNLLLNAVDAVGRMPPARRQVSLSTDDGGDEVRVSVADTGFGIAAERIGDIFEPFYTTKGGGKGMGMGLAIARGIVDAHAGRIGALNNPQGGATVWFSVPTSPEVPS